jgi:hypothetical protein
MRSLRALIGTDCAERIWITSRWEAWLDEDGRAAGKPVNQAATLLAQSYGWQLSLLGTVVIVGLDKDAAKPAELSPSQVDAIIRKVSCPPPALPKTAQQHERKTGPPRQRARRQRPPLADKTRRDNHRPDPRAPHLLHNKPPSHPALNWHNARMPES